MNFNDRDKIIALTPLWKGERFPDGRPKVADKHLDALYGMTLEEVWKPIFVMGYEHQFVGGAQFFLRAEPSNNCFFWLEHYELENNKTEEKNLCICLNMCRSVWA